MRPHRTSAAGGWPSEEPRPAPARRLHSRAARPPMEISSQPAPTSGPNAGHWCGPRRDNGCLAAVGLTALLPVASLGPDLPCADDPELFFAEWPDDLEAA